ncbi:MAG: hypothetical protein IKU48_04970 [Clostridia bacterium]|nr:hypothetical protein [Clostridia bacterium]
MKKFLTLIGLVLCFALMFSLVSCKNTANENVKETEEETAEETKGEEKPIEPTSAKELWELVDAAMENAESYEGAMTADMVMFMNGFKIESKVSGFEISIGQRDALDYYYYRFLKTEVLCEDLLLDEMSTEIEAYNQGMTFVSTIKGNSAQNFCSKMTVDEYLEFSTNVLSKEFDFGDCTKSDYLKNEDGSWSLSFSGYTKKSISLLLKETGFDEDMLSVDVIDVIISLTADNEYRVAEMSLELVFDVEETDTAIPVFKEVMKYSKYGEAKKTLEGIDPSEYTEVDDVAVLDKTTDAINEYAGLSEGSFELDITQNLKVGAETNKYTEKDSVFFGKINGGFVYTADSTINGMTTVNMDYRNGVQKITQGVDVETYNLSDDEAKAIVYNLINTAAYDKTIVTDVEKLGEGVYKFTVEEPNLASYEEALIPMGITCKSGKQSIVVTFAEDKLSKIESDLIVYGEMTVGNQTEAMELQQLTIVTVKEVNGSESNM